MFRKVIIGVLAGVFLLSFTCLSGCRQKWKIESETSSYYEEKYDKKSGHKTNGDPYRSRSVNEATTDKVGWGLGS